ncbi:MAG: hypothetical protein HY677_00205, partial [Chloroflexi bacterium]|nr:hypothetical protein [Chloroflexota bacterium]
MRRGKVLATLFLLLLSAASAACSKAPSSPAPTATAAPKAATPSTAAATPQAKWATKIADATNHSWPRRAIGMNGEVVVKAKPVRLLTLSLGYDEIT